MPFCNDSRRIIEKAAHLLHPIAGWVLFSADDVAYRLLGRSWCHRRLMFGIVCLEDQIGSAIQSPPQGPDNRIRYALHYWYNHGISKLPVGLGVRNWNFHVWRIPHQFGALAWGQAPWVFVGTLEN